MDAELVGRRQDLQERLDVVRVNLTEQSARLRVLLEQFRSSVQRPSSPPPSAPTTRLFATDRLRLGDVEVVIPRQLVRDGRGTRRLTPTEWQLLLFLLTKPDIVHSRSELAAGAWGAGFDGRDTEVEVYVSRLRRKLGSAAPLLETVRGQGYRFALWERGGGGFCADGVVPSQPSALAASASTVLRAASRSTCACRRAS